MRSATKIHQRLLRNILRAPMAFFDTTPSGRLTNRFGKDMNTIDNQIPGSTSAVLQFLLIMITFFIPIIYVSPIFVPILCPLMVIYVLLQVLTSCVDLAIVRVRSGFFFSEVLCGLLKTVPTSGSRHEVAHLLALPREYSRHGYDQSL